MMLMSLLTNWFNLERNDRVGKIQGQLKEKNDSKKEAENENNIDMNIATNTYIIICRMDVDQKEAQQFS